MGGSLKILVVVHESSRTGAPRIGGLIASALQKTQDVHLVTLSEGPLINWLQSHIQDGHFSVSDRAALRHTPFEARVDLARSFLEKHPADVVYVNSLAASEYLVAAKALGMRTVLHLHEKKDEMQSLIRLQFTKINIISFCDAVVLAGNGLILDMIEMFGTAPSRTLNWGIAIDTEEIIRLSEKQDVLAKSSAGRALEFGDRLLVGMVGYGSIRKGADIFYEVAKSLPEHDFVWIGKWDSIDVPFYDQFVADRLENFYISGEVENPYKYMKQFDIFFLSSREDPNPIVLAEAMLLQVPVLCFGNTTAVGNFLGRNAILVQGSPNLEDAFEILKKIDKSQLKLGWLTPARELIDEQFNVNTKIDAVVQLLNSL